MRLLEGQTQAGTSSCISTGFRLLYRDGEQNYCPGCGKRNWIIGRMMAECSFCATALPLDHAHIYGQSARPDHADQAPVRDDRRALRLVA